MHECHYEWIEEPHPQSRQLEYIRDCADCHHSPERDLWELEYRFAHQAETREGAIQELMQIVEEEYGD